MIQLSARDRRPLDRFSRVGSSAHLKCNEWLSKVSTSGDSDDDEGNMGFDRGVGPAMVHTAEESTSIVSKLMTLYKTLVLCKVSTAVIHCWIDSYDVWQAGHCPY